MNTKELTRRRELCSSLNIDFDEASELFSDETLESMQMAKVSGGNWFRVLREIIINGIAYFLIEKEDNTTGEIRKPDDFEGIVALPSDSTFIRVYNDGSYEIKTYGTGNPTPTGGQKPPSPSPSN